MPISWDQTAERLSAVQDILNDQSVTPVTGEVHVGVDLGTTDVVVLVLDSEGWPVAAFLEWAQVVKDGVVIDYIGAVDIVRRLVEKAEKKLDITISDVSTSFPPGTDPRLSTNILETLGLNVVQMMDEPSCVANLLELDKTAVVDIGGGTTGTAVVQDGKIVFSDDEPTGGTHISLVISGHFNISFEEAEQRKRNSVEYDILNLVKPVFHRICDIVSGHIQHYPVDRLIFSGGTCCLPNLQPLLEKELGIEVIIPSHPLLLTPLAIAALSWHPPN